MATINSLGLFVEINPVGSDPATPKLAQRVMDSATPSLLLSDAFQISPGPLSSIM